MLNSKEALYSREKFEMCLAESLIELNSNHRLSLDESIKALNDYIKAYAKSLKDIANDFKKYNESFEDYLKALRTINDKEIRYLGRNYSDNVTQYWFILRDERDNNLDWNLSDNDREMSYACDCRMISSYNADYRYKVILKTSEWHKTINEVDLLKLVSYVNKGYAALRSVKLCNWA